jgi:hypothetical protein
MAPKLEYGDEHFKSDHPCPSSSYCPNPTTDYEFSEDYLDYYSNSSNSSEIIDSEETSN